MNALPNYVHEVIEELSKRISLNELQASFQKVCHNYRNRIFAPFNSNSERVAYLVYRLPATYAVLLHIFYQLKALYPSFAPKSVIDIGSGPGTALLAAGTHFPEIKKAIAIERDQFFISFAKQVISYAVEWCLADIASYSPTDEVADLAIMSYSLGELTDTSFEKTLSILNRCRYIVIVEPGTKEGYKKILSARSSLIEKGFSVLAPCPHSKTCPLIADDWCHFSVRLPRTALHKKVKSGDLGYEDEKYSYVVLSKESMGAKVSRIIREPKLRSGHGHFVLCDGDGTIHETTISRKSPLYSVAKKACWGDTLPKEV